MYLKPLACEIGYIGNDGCCLCRVLVEMGPVSTNRLHISGYLGKWIYRLGKWNLHGYLFPVQADGRIPFVQGLQKVNVELWAWTSLTCVQVEETRAYIWQGFCCLLYNYDKFWLPEDQESYFYRSWTPHIMMPIWESEDSSSSWQLTFSFHRLAHL